MVSACARYVDVEWYSEKLPPQITDGSQPAQDPKGISHQIIYCKVRGAKDFTYAAEFENSYDRELSAYVALSLDGGEFGSIWGIYVVRIPAGQSRAVFDTRELPPEEREHLLESVFPSIAHSIEECSIHILGFAEGPRYKVVFPVAFGVLDR